MRMGPLVRRTQAPRGRPPTLKQKGAHREKVSVVGALTVGPDEPAWQLTHRTCVNGSFDSVREAEFLRDLLDRWPEPLIVVWDGNSTHRGPAIRQVLAEFPRLSIEPLPPYAPDLNPVEGLWSYEKCDRRANFAPQTVGQLDQVAQQDLADIGQNPELLKSFWEGTPLPPPDI